MIASSLTFFYPLSLQASLDQFANIQDIKNSSIISAF